MYFFVSINFKNEKSDISFVTIHFYTLSNPYTYMEKNNLKYKCCDNKFITSFVLKMLNIKMYINLKSNVHQ